MANISISILGSILIVMVFLFFFCVILSIYLIFQEMADFIEFMQNSFLELFADIENAVINFFDILIQDIIDLFDEALDALGF